MIAVANGRNPCPMMNASTPISRGRPTSPALFFNIFEGRSMAPAPHARKRSNGARPLHVQGRAAGHDGGFQGPRHLWLLEGQPGDRSEEHTSELQSLMRISYAVFCLKKKT